MTRAVPAKASLVPLAVVASVLAGCATQFDRFETGTRIGQLMRASRAETLDARLADAAFRMTEGQTDAEAKATLAADGAICMTDTCSWTVERRETVLEVAAGTRPPGPARTWRLGYAVRLQATPIRMRDDLAASVTSRSTVSND